MGNFVFFLNFHSIVFFSPMQPTHEAHRGNTLLTGAAPREKFHPSAGCIGEKNTIE
jgi:hypothetical protein